jgi:hypothetical protein
MGKGRIGSPKDHEVRMFEIWASIPVSLDDLISEIATVEALGIVRKIVWGSEGMDETSGILFLLKKTESFSLPDSDRPRSDLGLDLCHLFRDLIHGLVIGNLCKGTVRFSLQRF